MTSIYLDHNSTCPIDPRVADAIRRCHEMGFVNPASQHRPGQGARRALEEARAQVTLSVGAKTGGVDEDYVVFTSGGTEANNLALFGLSGQPPGEIIISSIEHPSVYAPAEELRRRGFEVKFLPADSSGRARVDLLPDWISDATRLVSLMLVNNETGVLQPVADAAQICRGAFTIGPQISWTAWHRRAGRVSSNFPGPDSFRRIPTTRMAARHRRCRFGRWNKHGAGAVHRRARGAGPADETAPRSL